MTQVSIQRRIQSGNKVRETLADINKLARLNLANIFVSVLIFANRMKETGTRLAIDLDKK